MLLSLEQWQRKYFAEPLPESTVRNWIRSGAIPARKIGGKWFVDEHVWLAAGNDLVERGLKAG